MHRILMLVILLVFAWMPPVYADHEPAKAKCPQNRKTSQAPEEFLKMTNPLEATEKRIKKGKLIYQVKASPLQCKHCHGLNGDGTGHMGLEANPPARNFSCSETMQDISGGQMFWAIKNGIPGT
ncbi:MAG: cytochrome C, partial [Nitrospinae bacterium]|nr:cytochrome C [Nitrospinota bacterium]